MPDDLRELAARVHERVMGLCAHDLHAYAKDNRDPSDDYKTYRCRKCKQTFRGLLYAGGKYPLPPYPTDIAAAWQVVERMRELGWHFEMFWRTDSDCDAIFRKEEHPYIPAFAAEWGETPPLAICKAALAACDAVEGERVDG